MGFIARVCVVGMYAGSLAALVLLSLACGQGGTGLQAAMTPGEALTPVERGRYLVSVLACNDCHTPMKMGAAGPEPDMARMLSGHPQDLVMPAPPRLPEGPWVWMGAGTNTAFAGPWGISYSPNLTPDQLSGMGIWTEEMFVAAMRTGRHMGQSRTIMPPMPWPAYRNLTDQDLTAIYAYLRSVPAISNQVPDSLTPEELAARDDEAAAF